jgi:hypothetical protein
MRETFRVTRAPVRFYLQRSLCKRSVQIRKPSGQSFIAHTINVSYQRLDCVLLCPDCQITATGLLGLTRPLTLELLILRWSIAGLAPPV